MKFNFKFINILELFVILIIIVGSYFTFFKKENPPIKVIDYKINDFITYSGMIKDNIFEGMGNLTYKNNVNYIGEFSDGRFSGTGVCSFEEGFVYFADFDTEDANKNIVIILENGQIWGRKSNTWENLSEN